MSYQKEQSRPTHSAEQLIPLSMASEIVAIRTEIEKNEQHKGKNRELVFAAFAEIQKALGKAAPAKTCEQCMGTWNKILQNWLLMYDVAPKSAKVRAGAFKAKQLVPKMPDGDEGAGKPEISYKEMIDLIKARLTPEEFAAINGGKPPKKAQAETIIASWAK